MKNTHANDDDGGANTMEGPARVRPRAILVPCDLDAPDRPSSFAWASTLSILLKLYYLFVCADARAHVLSCVTLLRADMVHPGAAIETQGE